MVFGPFNEMLPRFWLSFLAPYFAILVVIPVANATTVCRSDEGIINCSSPTVSSAELSNRMRRSAKLFETNLCRVKELSSSNDTWAADQTDEIAIYIRYSCDYSQSETSSSNSQQNTRLRYDATAKYEFLCAPRQYKMFESGFDLYSNGARMHWDSQGSSRPIPWHKVTSEERDRRLVPLFHIWCE